MPQEDIQSNFIVVVKKRIMGQLLSRRSKTTGALYSLRYLQQLNKQGLIHPSIFIQYPFSTNYAFSPPDDNGKMYVFGFFSKYYRSHSLIQVHLEITNPPETCMLGLYEDQHALIQAAIIQSQEQKQQASDGH